MRTMHGVDVEVLGHAGAHAGDVAVVRASPQPARPRTPVGGTGAGGRAGRAEVGGGIHGPSIGSRRAPSQSGITLNAAPRDASSLSGGPDARAGGARGIIGRPWQSLRPPGSASTSARSTCPTGSSAPATTAWWPAWRAAWAATSASTRTSCASPSWCSPSPTASARCSTWPAGRSFPTRTPPRRRPPAVRPPPSGPSGLGLLTLGAVLLFARAGLVLPPGSCGPSSLSAIGFGLVWARTDEEDRTRGLLWRAAGGGVLLVVGLGRAVRVGRRAVHHRRHRPGRARHRHRGGAAARALDRAAVARPRRRSDGSASAPRSARRSPRTCTTRCCRPWR